MRAYVPDYDLRVPGSLTEALALLAREPGVWQPFAGGTDLMVLLDAGKLSHK
jgi:CO/xanthine dehydrogenase FAD-binding subunit